MSTVQDDWGGFSSGGEETLTPKVSKQLKNQYVIQKYFKT